MGRTVFAYVEALEICRAAGATVVNLSLSGLSTATGPELAELENRITDLRANWRHERRRRGRQHGRRRRVSRALPAESSRSAPATRSGGLCSFSARGAELDIAALGCGVTVIAGAWRRDVGAGTSFAAPVVSAAARGPSRLPSGLCELRAGRGILLVSTARRAADACSIVSQRRFRAADLGDAHRPSLAPLRRAPTARRRMRTRRRHRSCTAPSRDLGVRRPRVRIGPLRGAGYSRVSASSGVPDFGRAVFVVDGRRYRAPHRIICGFGCSRPTRAERVPIEVPTVGARRVLRRSALERRPRSVAPR